MPKSRVELKVFNPRGEVQGSQTSPSPRLKDLDGKKIGLILNRVTVGDVFFPYLEKALKKRAPRAEFRLSEIPISGVAGSWEVPLTGKTNPREAKLEEIANTSDGVVIGLGISGGSTTRTTPDAVKIEKLGKPAVLIVANCFKPNARFIARSKGLSDLAVATLPTDYVPPREEIEKLNIGDKVADEIIEGLTQWSPQPPELKEVPEKILRFSGKDYSEALGNMEKYYLNHGWGDGFPLVAPTEEAVNEMLEGTELPSEHVLALFEPGGGKATIEKIAINAVMAGCLPQYMPVILAAIETIIDPMFDLVGVQCTSGQLAPLFVISGQKLIEELNINDSFCTIGPGWRANATIGRAIRLIMTNLGHTWPGMNDMKAFGNPFRYVTLMAENEAAYMGAWEPLRVAEGFAYDQPTISVMPAMSWQPDLVLPTPPTVDRIIAQISNQAKVKYDRFASNCVYNNLALISPSAFDAVRRAGYSRADMQKALYEAIQLPGTEVFDGREGFGFRLLPKWVLEKHRADPRAPVPLLLKPESLKICVAGGPGPDMIAYIGTWGYGPSYFVTKPVKLPRNWNQLLQRYKGWESPLVK